MELRGGSIAAGIGFSWGHGTLNFGGQPHTFKISGVSLVDLGAANVSAAGSVYNLKNLADFNGNYVALTAGMTVAGGGSIGVGCDGFVGSVGVGVPGSVGDGLFGVGFVGVGGLRL